jgi:hypothetical protein
MEPDPGLQVLDDVTKLIGRGHRGLPHGG